MVGPQESPHDMDRIISFCGKEAESPFAANKEQASKAT